MRRIQNLTARKCETIKEPGYYADGQNLYLQVSKALSKSWLFIYKFQGRKHEVGLGGYPDISLAVARDGAARWRKVLIAGDNPIEIKREQEYKKHCSRIDNPTFAQCANKFIESHQAGWKNPKHAQQWKNTLDHYVLPIIGNLQVKQIDTGLVMRVLEPIWLEKNETASRLRGRIENILDWASVHKYRQGDNPARWRGHLDKLLSSPNKIQRIKHFKALPYHEMNGLLLALRSNSSISAMALEFLILTAARTGEVIGSQWNEIDFNQKIWIIPAERMKVKKEHRVPIASRTLEILSNVKQLKVNDYIFPGRTRNGGLSNAAMDKLLQVTLNYDATVHGFRSTFRDWASEITNFPHEMCEMALAHSIKNQAEAAYRRGDMIEKRRVMMEAWLTYIETKPCKVK
ncbi:tyrosine-type recombinase/integrase [Nitrosomonas sp. ANs5]|uniref:tyrosine-type recombinase/integrase n=1 Tax=Nitrosomonas sp. ANs5 TaxID=3423941 RepID=UPI003D33D4C3